MQKRTKKAQKVPKKSAKKVPKISNKVQKVPKSALKSDPKKTEKGPKVKTKLLNRVKNAYKYQKVPTGGFHCVSATICTRRDIQCPHMQGFLTSLTL